MKNSFVAQLHNKENIDSSSRPKVATKSMNFGKMIKYKAQLFGYESPPVKENSKLSRRFSQLVSPDSNLDSNLKFSQIISPNEEDSIFKNKTVRFQDEESEGQSSQVSCGCSRNAMKKTSILKKATSLDRASVNSGTSDMGQIDSLNAKSSLKDKGSACSNEKYAKELKILKYQNIKFFDKIFPPGGSSLCYSRRRIEEFKQIKWMRIQDLFKGKKKVLYSPLSASRCIYNSGPAGYGLNLAIACNSLSNSNRCLERIFQQQRVLGLCIYYLRINHDGIWRYVIIDDYIPVVREDQQDVPAFMRIFQNEQGEIQIWPLLIQKAMAKIYNSYESLFDDSVQNILYDLTGFPPETINLQDQQSEFKFRSSVTNSQTVSIMTQPYNKEYFTCQSYPICEEGSSPSTTFFSLDPKLKLMNLQRYQNIIMEISDLRKQFKTSKLYCINDNFYSLGCVIKQHINSISLRRFVIKQRNVSCILSLIQKDKKYYNNNGYDYAWARIMLAIKDGANGYRWVSGKYEKGKCLALYLNLDPGEYFVIVNGDWKQRAFEMTLNYQGSQQIQFERRTMQQHPSILTETCIDIAQRFGLFRQVNKSLCSYSLVDRSNGFILQNINNQVNRSVVFHKQYRLSGKNYQILDRSKYFQDQSNFVEVQIKPNANFTFIAKMVNGLDQELLGSFKFD